MQNNNIFDALLNRSGIVLEYVKKHDEPYIGFDRVKPIFMQYIYQESNFPKVSEPLFFIRIKFAKFCFLTEEGVEKFCKIQHHYHILMRFVNRWKISRHKVYDIDEDLCLVPFNAIDPRKIIHISHNKCIYKFNIHDLINIIRASLTHQYFMIPQPRMPKNPYINMPFNRHQLITIFLRLWELKIKIKPIMHYFFQCKFNIDVFINRHRMLLSDMAIDSYLSKDSTVSSDVIIDILNLIKIYSNPFLKINIHPNFPSKPLFKIFRPYLKLYYRMKLFKCPIYEEKLRKGLCCFGVFNPGFGKKYIRTCDNQIGFDDRHLEFGDFTDGAFFELRNMSVFDIITKNKRNDKNAFCISIMPLKQVKYVHNETIIDYPVLESAYTMAYMVAAEEEVVAEEEEEVAEEEEEEEEAEEEVAEEQESESESESESDGENS